MAVTIKQKITFPVSAKKLYDFYMKEDLHAEITGTKVRVEKVVGSAFSAGDGYIKGKILHLKPKRMIAQTWRGQDWNREDMDSILVLTFIQVDDHTTQLEMVHANVPEEQADGIRKSWHEHYWKPWKRYIARNIQGDSRT